MFSKALYKQSWKANWVLWLSTTIVSTFVLVVIMFLVGGEGLGKLTKSFTETIVYEELSSKYENSSLTYYTLTDETLYDFDKIFIDNYIIEIKENPFVVPNEETFMNVSLKTFMEINSTLINRIKEFEPTIELDDIRYQELSSAILLSLSNSIINDSSDYDVLSLIIHLTEDDYLNIWTTGNTPENLYEVLESNTRRVYRNTRAKNSSSTFLAISLTNEDVLNEILENLAGIGITKEKYFEFGFDQDGLIYLSNSAILTYQARIDYEIEVADPNADLKEIQDKLKKSITINFMSQLPEDITSMMRELETQDMYSYTLVSVFYKIVGMLVAIIYIIMASVNLISNQVDTGSMAYILSTGTKREQVTNSQTLFLVSSTFFMFIVTTAVSVIMYTYFTPVQSSMTYGKLLIFGLGTFLIAFAISGINFLSSTIFNRSRLAMAVGGGLSILMLIFTILGIFGSPIMPAMMRLEALNVFNYFTLITLLNEGSVIDGTLHVIINYVILFLVGLITYILAGIIFKKKDLPL